MLGAGCASLAAVLLSGPLLLGASAQDPAPPKPAPPVERLGDNLLRIGNIRVDTKAREISVSGTVNEVQALEFLANATGGFKAYESVLTLDTDGITFNVALVLIGLERKNAYVPKMHFDPTPPKGDPVEIWVEWEVEGKMRRVPAEELIVNEVTKKSLAPDSWVYTGSTFIAHHNAYMADIEGTLIGFVHTPAPVIEHSAPLVGGYGSLRLNPSLELKPGVKVRLTVRALPRG